ncbi:uncharacterized protein LOC121941611 [Plectropomus leopardus]|uniref:uncharacterized protein LOC121941611 n=1 Tax=Plectropomus leopardus TaxID=160734 RepID=UPI001C4BF473|nr:uncharacterized protein LOC121941611 [Plectropomus leopardus]
MNPLDWDAVRTLQRNWHPNHQNDVHNSMENSSRTSNNWDPHCDYSRHTADEAHSSRMVVNVDRKRLSPPPHNFYMKESDLEDPDGAPVEIEEDDPELIRKCRELREIEERIMLKKAAIALKTVEPFVRKTAPPDFSPDKQPATCKGASLKDRVNVILQQRHPFGFFSKVHLPKERMNSSSLQDDHPLKLRVKALMKQRSMDSCVLSANREVPDVIQPSTSQRVTSAATEDSSVNEGFQRFLRVLNKGVDMDVEFSTSQSVTSPVMEDSSVSKGFQRFLSVLNKGVDMDFLSRIVNDDSEDIPLGKEVPNIQPPAAENKSDPPVSSESQRSNSGASLPGRTRTSSGKKTDLPQ